MSSPHRAAGYTDYVLVIIYEHNSCVLTYLLTLLNMHFFHLLSMDFVDQIQDL